MVGFGGRGFRLGEKVEAVTEAIERIEEALRLRFRQYPAYKDSGVEWLGTIPSNWEVKRLTDLANLVNGFPFDSKLFDRSHGIPLVRIRDLFNTTTEVKWSGDPVPEADIHDGDILIGMDGDFSVAWWAQGPALLNQRLCCSRARSECISQRYMFYCLPFPLKALNDVTYATTVKHLSSLDVLKFRLPIPSHNEQRGIAAFLDRETAKIDGLVARKERLIELLQEKRTALITRAVTRGLDPNVPKKDSGVEWLDKIPAHWEVKRLKHQTPETTVGIVVTPSKYYVDEGIPCLRSLNVSRGTINMQNLVYISENANELHRKSKIFAGDVVVVRTGKAGTAAVVPKELDGANCIDLLIVRRSEELLPQFVYYYLNSHSATSQAEELSVGAIQAHYNTSTLAQLMVPKIPKNEQSRIVIYLDQATGEIDALIAKVRQAIDHLKEFRTALISAAVTGKIDVREEAP